MAAPDVQNIEKGSGLWKLSKTQKAMSEGMQNGMYEKADFSGLERNGDREHYREYCEKFEGVFLGLLEGMNVEREVEGVRKEFFEAVSTDGLNCDVTVFRPDDDELYPGVVYIHGGGMAIFTGKEPFLLSAGWSIANMKCVIMFVHFTNSTMEAYPRGLNDCCDAVKWFVGKADDFKIDTQGKGVCVTGESGGGNLCIATAMKLKDEEGLVASCFARCPYTNPVSVNGNKASHREMAPADLPADWEELFSWLFQDLYTSPDSEDRNSCLAWPEFATKEDLQGMCPTMVLVNECDSLRDDGIDFYRKLQDADVPSMMQIVGGTMHGGEAFDPMWMNLSHKQTVDFAQMCLTQDFSPWQPAEEEKAENAEAEGAAEGAEP